VAKSEMTPQANLNAIPMDGAQIEIATGLSLGDIEALKNDGSEATRARIAAKFAAQYDQIHHGKTHKLTDDILNLFARDQSKTVRLKFVEKIKSSDYLPATIANHLARDDLEIAEQILSECPILSDQDLESILQEMPESYAIPIADRRPLSAAVSTALIEHRGTLRVVCRLIDNRAAELSETSLTWIFEWSLTNPRIAKCLKQRPHLPFAMMKQQVTALGEELKWDAISRQSMTKGEAVQLRGQMRGATRNQFRRDGTRHNQILHDLRLRYERGELNPIDIIRFLRDQNINRVELSLAVVTRLELRQIRNLLYGVDKRGLIALCLRAGFSTSEYLAFRIALGLVEVGSSADRKQVTYGAATAEFAKEQYDAMRDQPDQISVWF